MYNSDIKREQEISRITAEVAEGLISQRENFLGYPIEFFTLTQNPDDPKWEDVTYYTGKRKTVFGDKFSNAYSYWIYVLSNPSMPDLLKIGFTIQNPSKSGNKGCSNLCRNWSGSTL